MGELDELKTLLQTTLSSINTNIALQQQMIMQLQNENKEMREMMKGLAKQKSEDPLKTEVLSTYKRNKKRMIKNKIMETIKQHERSIPEIKEIIVDQLAYCSKATFYRYIEELKNHDFILVARNRARIKPLVETV